MNHGFLCEKNHILAFVVSLTPAAPVFSTNTIFSLKQNIIGLDILQFASFFWNSWMSFSKWVCFSPNSMSFQGLHLFLCVWHDDECRPGSRAVTHRFCSLHGSFGHHPHHWHRHQSGSQFRSSSDLQPRLAPACQYPNYHNSPSYILLFPAAQYL